MSYPEILISGLIIAAVIVALPLGVGVRALWTGRRNAKGEGAQSARGGVQE